MRKWISIMVMVAFALATIMPTTSHASTHEHASVDAGEHSDAAVNCDHAKKEATDNHADQNSNSKKPCCGGELCKCSTGCNGGLAKIFGQSDVNLVSLTVSKSHYSYTDEYIDSALTERMIRPPRA